MIVAGANDRKFYTRYRFYVWRGPFVRCAARAGILRHETTELVKKEDGVSIGNIDVGNKLYILFIDVRI